MVARIETEADIQAMREAGRCASRVLEMIGEYVQPGVSTEALNERCHRFIVEELDCIPAPLNYGGGGGLSVCLSACLHLCLPACLSVCLPVPVLASLNIYFLYLFD